MIAEVELAWRFDVGNRLGECVLWDDRRGVALWTDIEGARLWSWRFGAARPVCVALGDRLASFGLTTTSGVLIGAFARHFARFDAESGAQERLANVEPDTAGTMMNDGRVDRDGTFWASSKVLDEAGEPAGKLWRLDEEGRAEARLEGFKLPNGLAWSLDGRAMYLSDSLEGTIWRFEFDANRGPTARAMFARTPAGSRPDGACVDAQDHLWVAHWGSGRIARYRPDGELDQMVEVAPRHPTCVAFGGPGLDHLFVTSERPTTGANDGDGALLVYRTPFRGVLESRAASAAAPQSALAKEPA